MDFHGFPSPLRSFKTLFWAMLLLAIVMFIFGVTFMQLAYNHVRSGVEGTEVMAFYGTMGRASQKPFRGPINYI